ncbi:MAG: hypothetical protein HY700_08870 [Gemmatimonadetes bacterium]|nr:hypothetical protein [Gemmatimonadota bacterium]
MTRMTRFCLTGALVAAGLLASDPARAQTSTGSGLFDSDDILEFRLATDLKTLMDDRDSLKAGYHPGTLGYLDAAGQRVSIDVQLRTRGHWRRQRKNCDFAPLKIDFPKTKDQPAGSPFAGEGDLKLITHCRTKDAAFEQYVLREYMVYRLYNMIAPTSFRARLARTTYVDLAGKQDSITRFAFLLEDDKRLAERTNSALLETKGARFDDLDPEAAATMSAFEYLIGGTDWSLVALHNIVLTQNKETGAVIPVPYDFDWSGIVFTKYSFPDYRLPIKTVRERIYRGICRTYEQWQPVLQRFQEQKGSFYAAYDSLPLLDPKYSKEVRDYLDGFYKTIERPASVKVDLIGPCKEA